MFRRVVWMGVAALVTVGCEGTQRESDVVASPALPGAAASGASGAGGSSDTAGAAGERPQASAIDEPRAGSAGERSEEPDVDDAGSRPPFPQDSADAGAPAEPTCPGCLVGDVCFASGELEPGNACRVCDPERESVGWSSNDGATCDDGLFCTLDDACSDGACTGTRRECEDGVTCNGVSVCNETSDTCSPDINGCGNGAICNVQTNACVSTCAGCLVDGVCFASGTEANGNPCLVCDPTRDATSFSIAVGKSCGADPSACSQQDSCDTAGRCQPNHLAAGTPCGSSVTSTCDQPDSCDGAGNCQQRLVPNGTPCDDGAFCATGDQCQAGQCVSTGTQNCGANRACNETTNQCQCQGCTIGGQCVAAGAVNPANPCQVCDPGRNTSAFSAGANGNPCDDGAFCTVGDQCQGGQCVPTGSLGCGNNSLCNEATDRCECQGCAVGGMCAGIGQACTGTQLCAGEASCVTPVVIASWSIAGAISASTLAASSTSLNVTATSLTVAPAFGRQPAFSDVFAVTSWPTTPSIDLTQYFEFGVSTATPRSVIYDHVEFSIASNNLQDGSSSWQIRSSVDNFVSVAASGTTSIIDGTGPTIRASVRSAGTRMGTVTFRLYLFNNSGPDAAIRGLRGGAGAGSGLSVFGVVL